MCRSPIQTKRDVRAILASAGLKPDKSFGQNFLIDGNYMRKLVDAAQMDYADTVLEVGGGTGGLSDQLADRVGRLIIVEIDHDLAPLLVKRFANRSNVIVLEADVLAKKSLIAPIVLKTLHENLPQDGRCLLVANLPYNVATPLLINFLTARPFISRFCFTIQREVADRLQARAGGKDFGPLAIVVQTTCDIQRLARIPASAFWPQPKVESAMIRLDRKRHHPFEAADSLAEFIALVRAAFTHRRKTLGYNLSRYLNDCDLSTAADQLDLTKRAEVIDIEAWISLGKTLIA